MNQRLLLEGTAGLVALIVAVIYFRRRPRVVTVAGTLAFATIVPILLAFTPEYRGLVITGGALFTLSLSAAWIGRSRPLFARVMLSVTFASIVPIIVGFVAEEPAGAAAVGSAAASAAKYRVTVTYISLRGSIFSGFLTIGGFLLSLKTFIVVKMKEGVFDTDRHIKKVLKERARTQAKVAFYGELGRLRRLLFLAIVGAFATSVLQVTVGLVEHVYASTACFTLAAYEIGLLAQSLMLINTNLHDWFDQLERDAEDEHGDGNRSNEVEAAQSPRSAPAGEPTA